MRGGVLAKLLNPNRSVNQKFPKASREEGGRSNTKHAGNNRYHVCQKKERQQRERARVKEMGKKSRNPGDNFHTVRAEGKNGRR